MSEEMNKAIDARLRHHGLIDEEFKLTAKGKRRSPKYKVSWSMEGGYKVLDEGLLVIWKSKFPNVDSDAAKHAAHLWMLGKPTLWKSINPPSRLNTWFTKAQGYYDEKHPKPKARKVSLLIS